MKRLMVVLCVAVVVGLESAATQAAIVTLVPNNLIVAPGGTVNVSVYLDMTDNDPASIDMSAISTDFVYDKSVFTYDKVADVTQGDLLTLDWGFLAGDDTHLRVGGYLNNYPPYYENLAQSGTLFTFNLNVANDVPTGSYELAWGDAGNGVGFDYRDENYNDVVLPSFGVTINVGSEVSIPEPTTFIIWSLLGSLGLVFAWRKRKAA
jgi:hypothetical protein